MNFTDADKKWKNLAMKEAQKAFQQDEVPIGAIIVKDNKIISSAHNQKEQNKIATHHAEILAINEACKKLDSWRLSGCILYSTLEPCLMCAGAIHQARIAKVVFSCFDPKAGGLGSIYNFSTDKRLNHRHKCYQGLLAEESKNILQNFFRNKRKKKPLL